MAVESSDRGYGPDDMGDNPQETEVEEYERYIEDPPDDLVITEDFGNDAGDAYDWADRHPGAAGHDGTPATAQFPKAAEESAVRERRIPR